MLKKRTGAFASGIALGALVGVAASLLLDPRTSRRTQRALKNATTALPDRVPKLIDNLSKGGNFNGTKTADLPRSPVSSALGASASSRGGDRAGFSANGLAGPLARLEQSWQHTLVRLRQALAAGRQAARQERQAMDGNRIAEAARQPVRDRA